ncbi:MAG: AAA family ATPase [Chloroflexi bacterium]|nr:AAA family ATPase [Chloroflexota bacterium]
MRFELPPEKLCRTFDPRDFRCETTDQVQPLNRIIGQDRAVRSLHLGLEIQSRGFNIYVSGPPGTGKMTAIQGFLEELARGKTPPNDWCYLHNFQDPYRPKVLALPAGMGRALQRDAKVMIARVRADIPQAFESKEYVDRRTEAGDWLSKERESIFEELGSKARQAGFALQVTPMGILTIPLVRERPLTEEEFRGLKEEERREIARQREAFQEEIREAMKRVLNSEKVLQERIQAMDREVALYVTGHLVDDLIEKYGDFPQVVQYLREVQEDVIGNLDQFRPQAQAQQAPAPPVAVGQDLFFRRYEVNVVVDNGHRQGLPVVTEWNPTYSNLFGRVEKESQMGALYTDVTLIRGGSIHEANGGYLVIPIEELLRNSFSYVALKRALGKREVTIEDLGESLGYMAMKSLKPDPIPLDLKVVLVGPPMIYQLLYNADSNFSELFKIKADFDTRMEVNEENVRDYVAFICTLCTRERLKHLDARAVARVLAHSARLAEDQGKLTTRFSEIADIIREASYWATQGGVRYVNGSHVQKAIEEKVYRSNLIQERIQDMFKRGIFLIGTEGARVGQVNGLAVISLGDYAFGKPSRITAALGLGRAGVLDIEREARMGGPIHTKGVLILGGYLTEKYSQDKPLTLSARLVFEQSYEGVEGDSASGAELFALLSALSGVPIRQGIAVTGSVNQKGETQAIGGVNEKIEGFFDVCRAKGLTGDQGVMIPASNVQNLMLREDVVEASRQGKFHIWAIDTVDEGIEVLTGLSAGERGADGHYPEGTINYLVDKRLRETAQLMRRFGADGPTPRAREDET